MNIAGRNFGPGAPCVVAEVSCNHSGRENLAHALIDAAKEAGADAVKFQLYEPSDLTLRSDLPHFRLHDGAWAGRTLWDLYTEARTPREWFPGLFAHARDVGLIPFASVFSLEGVGYLESLDCPAYKIASAEVSWVDLVREVARTGKPVILSDGCATEQQMFDALSASCGEGVDPTVLRCVAEYPANPTTYSMRMRWGGHWGISDHSCNPLVPAVAAALGASMVEAHLMLPAREYMLVGAPHPLDAGHSYDALPLSAGFGFSGMVEQVRLAAKIAHAPHTEQRNTQPFRRRLVWARDLPQGHIVTPGDVLNVRCAEGAEPDELDDIVGDALSRAVRYGEPVNVDDMRAEAA